MNVATIHQIDCGKREKQIAAQAATETAIRALIAHEIEAAYDAPKTRWNKLPNSMRVPPGCP